MTVASGPQTHRQVEQSRSAPQPKEEKHVGGVAAKLDYEMSCMNDFVVEMTQAIIYPTMGNKLPSTDFKQWVHSMLSATRLPSTTIALGLHYLSIRMGMLPQGGQHRINREKMYTMITIGLTLGSKFLDDNTFINRSWSDVSGIEVAQLNKEELDWLISMNWELHRSPHEEHGLGYWLTQWKNYESRAAARAAARTEEAGRNKLAPINTNLQRHGSVHSVHSNFSPAPAQDMFSRPNPNQFAAKPAQAQFTPVYSSYDPWMSSHPSADDSPASAPHTGPTTPEFFYGASVWNHPEGYSRRTMFGLQPVTQLMPQQQAFNHEQYQHYAPAAWNGHGTSCFCMLCKCQQQTSFFPGPSYRLEPAMA
jgi:hypothetical protein